MPSQIKDMDAVGAVGNTIANRRFRSKRTILTVFETKPLMLIRRRLGL